MRGKMDTIAELASVGRSQRSERSRSGHVWLWALCAGYSLWSLLGLPGASAAAWLPNFLLAFGGLLATILVCDALGSLAPDPRLRRAWLLLALAIGLWNAGDWAYLIIGDILGGDADASYADVLYLLFYPTALAGLLAIPQPRRLGSERWAFWLDLGAVITGTSIGYWYLLVRPAVESAGSTPAEIALAVAYPVGDLALLFALAVALLRRIAPHTRRGLVWLASGLAAMLVADTGYSILTLTGEYESGGIQDVIYLISASLCALAARFQAEDLAREDTGEEPARLRGAFAVTYGGVASGYALLLWAALDPAQSKSGLGLLAGAALASTCLVIGRQLLASRESLRRLRDESLRMSEARFRALVQHASDVVAVLSADGRVGFVSPSIERILGLRAADVVGLDLRDLLAPDDVADSTAFFARTAAQAGHSERAQWSARNRAGRDVEIEVIGTNLLDEPLVQGIVLNVRDVSERAQLERELAHQALHDPLTGLANRTLLHDRTEHALARARRTRESIAVALLDLDHFKNVNDSLGHAAGDALLREVGRRITACARGTDTVARLGGDEFAVLFEDAGSRENLHAIATRILAALAAPFSIDGRSLLVGASVGIARASEADLREDLLRHADVALYAAKREERGCVQVYDDGMHRSVVDRMGFEADLRRALAAEALEVHYQPIVELASRRIVATEALARWTCPIRGAVPPSEFVPVAEEIGLVSALGAFVLRSACREAACWPGGAGGEPLAVHVNLSGRQILDPGLPSALQAVLDDSRLDARRLVLEVTESVAMHDTRATLARLEELRAIGVRIAIDDFGTGYSSLSYLHRFPIDELKIDRSFVQRIERAADEDPVTAAVLAIARAIGVDVVAEGIETEAQRESLLRQGCLYGQGYLFARPLAPAPLRQLLARSQAGSPRAPDNR